MAILPARKNSFFKPPQALSTRAVQSFRLIFCKCLKIRIKLCNAVRMIFSHFLAPCFVDFARRCVRRNPERFVPWLDLRYCPRFDP